MKTIQDLVNKLEEINKSASGGLWDPVCCFAAIRHLVRNVDHSSYCMNESPHKIFDYDGTEIAELRNLLSKISRIIKILMDEIIDFNCVIPRQIEEKVQKILEEK